MYGDSAKMRRQYPEAAEKLARRLARRAASFAWLGEMYGRLVAPAPSIAIMCMARAAWYQPARRKALALAVYRRAQSARRRKNAQQAGGSAKPPAWRRPAAGETCLVLEYPRLKSSAPCENLGNLERIIAEERNSGLAVSAAVRCEKYAARSRAKKCHHHRRRFVAPRLCDRNRDARCHLRAKAR